MCKGRCYEPSFPVDHLRLDKKGTLWPGYLSNFINLSLVYKNFIESPFVKCIDGDHYGHHLYLYEIKYANILVGMIVILSLMFRQDL